MTSIQLEYIEVQEIIEIAKKHSGDGVVPLFTFNVSENPETDGLVPLGGGEYTKATSNMPGFESGFDLSFENISLGGVDKLKSSGGAISAWKEYKGLFGVTSATQSYFDVLLQRLFSINDPDADRLEELGFALEEVAIEDTMSQEIDIKEEEEHTVNMLEKEEENVISLEEVLRPGDLVLFTKGLEVEEVNEDGVKFVNFELPISLEQLPEYTIVAGEKTQKIEDDKRKIEEIRDKIIALGFDPELVLRAAQLEIDKPVEVDSISKV